MTIQTPLIMNGPKNTKKIKNIYIFNSYLETAGITTQILSKFRQTGIIVQSYFYHILKIIR
jgi:hypothetical protein